MKKHTKQLILTFFIAFITVSLVVFLFTLVQVYQEKKSLVNDIERRSQLLADSLKESVEPYYISESKISLQKVVDKFANREQLIGIVVYDNKGKVFTISSGLSQNIPESSPIPSLSMSSNQSLGDFTKIQNSKFYIFSDPLHKDDEIAGSLVVIQSADYIDLAIYEIWKNNLIRLLIQVFIFSLVGIFVIRWLIFKPLYKIINSAKLAQVSKTEDDMDDLDRHSFFQPLASEISKMSKSLLKAKSAASHEARLRLEKLDTPWTEERLKEFTKAYLKNRTIYMVSSREPFVHEKNKDEIVYKMPASGMVTAIEPLMEACGGLWLAHGSGNADKETVDSEDKIKVPPDDPKYTLKRVWLTEKNQKGYYLGFSNEALWPLCHMVHTRPIFRKEDWQEYRIVNGKFAQSLLAEIKNLEKPIILIQDFHFSLLPLMIKKSRPDAQIGIFWHIPWPNAESFSICPWRKEILRGILGADVVGFHTRLYGNNFIDTVSKELEALVDSESLSITHSGHSTKIKSFPISVPFTDNKPKNLDNNKKKEILNKLGIKTKYFGLGVERLDYTKGILERFKGIELFLKAYPEYKKQFTFLQIAPISREGVEKYRDFAEEVTKEAERINEELGTSEWQPIILVKKHHTHEELYYLYRSADICMVTSLHDGMNLVAKEFVAARDDESGVLILSHFTGASRDLKDALIINPYGAEETAESIKTALNMSKTEQRIRMKRMRNSLKDYNVYKWSAELIKAVADSF